ncbi:MAG TPA: glycosyltransferase family 9 protein [Jatrophihabitans sp.]|nr:glycosyltransferase family 9 protein [Jatrophihabitans sp.]
MKTTLALRAIGLGDFLTGLPALQALRWARPDDRLVLAAPAHFQPLLPLGVPVDELCPTDELSPIPWQGPVELAVDLHGNGPASRRLLDRLRPGRVLGFGYPGRPGPRWLPDEPEVHRWLRLIQEGLPAGNPRRCNQPAACHPAATDSPAARPAVRLSVPQVPAPEGAIVLHPGAAAPARRWPVERFAALARLLHEAGQRVVVTGSAGEHALVERVCRDGAATGWVGPTLQELFALVARARLVICGDTGVAHVASSYRTPSVLLFGPVSPARWGPPASGPHRVLWHGDGTGDPHGAVLDPALARIGVDEVLQAAFAMLHRAGHPRSHIAPLTEKELA